MNQVNKREPDELLDEPDELLNEQHALEANIQYIWLNALLLMAEVLDSHLTPGSFESHFCV